MRDPKGSSIEGRTLGSYEILRRLGQGGIGAVYEARHIRTGRRYAVKALLPDSEQDAASVQRFQREAKTLAALGHASIVAVHDFDVSEGTPFLVMDLLEGEDLAQRLERGALPVEDTLHIVEHVADALSAAHAQGILHRDLKPSNVFLARRAGDYERAMLLDFGLAKFLDGNDPRLTASGATMGTPLYMSPEQARGETIDVRSDVYSLGAILFECLTGTPPFGGDNLAVIISKVLTQPAPTLRERNAAAPARFEPLVASALAKDPAARPQTVDAFRESLAAVRSALGIPQTAYTPAEVAVASARTGPATAHAPTALATPRVEAPRGLAATSEGPPRPDHSLAATTPRGESVPAARDPSAVKIVALAVGSLLLVIGGAAGALYWNAHRDSPTIAAQTPVETPPPVAPSEPRIELRADLRDTMASEPESPTEPSEPRMHGMERRRPPAAPTPRTTMAPAPPSGDALAVLAARQRGLIDGQRGLAERRIATYTAFKEDVVRFERGLSETRRPPTCDARPDLSRHLQSEPSLHTTVDAIDRSLQRLCDAFDAWESPSPQARVRMADLPERFARARRDIERRDEERLPAAERDELLRLLDAAERASRAGGRFPCGTPEFAALQTHAASLGATAAQPALQMSRNLQSLCNTLEHHRIAPAVRQVHNSVRTAQQVADQLIAAQRRLLESLDAVPR